MTRRACSLAALAAALVVSGGAPHAAPGAPEASYVLIVAHNASHDPGVRPLRFADDDGARYFELFSLADPTRIALLAVLDADTARTHPVAARAARVPWMRAVREEVQRIAHAVERDNRAGRRTRFTFVYIGHGNVARDGEGYVNLQDVRLRRRDLFREVVDPVPAGTIHLVIDACKSYYLVARGPRWREDRGARAYGDEVRAFLGRSTLEANPHVGAIVSASGDEEVHEWSALRSGVFSHQLRSALLGAADLNGDGRVEYSEIGAFIAAANRRVTLARARIRPFLRPPPAERHAALFSPGLARRGPQLELARGARGRFAIEDGRGVRVADLHKAAGLTTRLALAPEQRHFIRHGATEAVLAAGRRGVVPLAGLDREPARSEPRGAVDAAYRAELFAFPLSRTFYEGYLATTDLPGVEFRGGLDDASAGAAPGGERPERGLTLELGYALSPAVLDLLHGAQHGAALGLTYDLGPLFYLALRLELGASPQSAGGLSYTLLRTAALVGAGLRWRLVPWAALAVEGDVGYQALVQTGQDNSDAAGAKIGTRLALALRPWPARLGRLGLVLHGGLYGHVARLGGRRVVAAVPEGGLAISYGF